MGWTPADVDACSLFQFGAAVEGFNEGQNGDETIEPPTDDEERDILIRAGKL